MGRGAPVSAIARRKPACVEPHSVRSGVVRCGGEAGYLQCSCFPRKVWRPPRSVWCGLSSSAFIVDRDCVAVGVLKRERPAEGAIDGLREDRHVVLGELVMKGLGVVGP